MHVVSIERVDVAEGRIEALVRIPDPARLRTVAVPRLAPRLLAVLPGLEKHRCENQAHRRFSEELSDTETPHLLEHIAEELMALSGSPRWLKGETRWDFKRDGDGIFRITLGYDDDLVALAALTAGVGIIDWLFSEAPPPDVDAMVDQLREVRTLS